MVKNMQETFIEMINQSTWMDESSRKIAIEKVTRIYSKNKIYQIRLRRKMNKNCRKVVFFLI